MQPPYRPHHHPQQHHHPPTQHRHHHRRALHRHRLPASLVVLTGDVRIAAAGPYRIGLNEVAIGLPVPILAMELARDRLQPAALTRATLLAHIHSPEEALAAGYVDSLAPPDQVVARALEEANRLSELGKAPLSSRV